MRKNQDIIFNNKKGFTLIELVLVIAILGILASLAIPKFNDYREEVKYNKFLSDIGSLQTATYFAHERNPKIRDYRSSYPSEMEKLASAIAKELGKTSIKWLNSQDYKIIGIEIPDSDNWKVHNESYGIYIHVSHMLETMAKKISDSLGYGTPTTKEASPRNNYIYYDGDPSGGRKHVRILLYEY